VSFQRNETELFCSGTIVKQIRKKSETKKIRKNVEKSVALYGILIFFAYSFQSCFCGQLNALFRGCSPTDVRSPS